MRSLSEMTDNELITLSKADDQEAFACLLGRYSSMIHAKASAKEHLSGCDVDDLSQEAAIGFFNAVKSFDPNKGASFRTYAELCVDRVLVSAVRMYLSQKNRPLNDHRELVEAEMMSNTLTDDLSASSGNPEGRIFEKENVGRLTEAIASRLTELEKTVVEMRLRGFSYEKTAKLLGISAKSVDNAIQRVRKKMKSFQTD
ncbi:MAG: sigma-70 family RNA polymerase sigma factor [Clostridia bacterium]|nr:sigma-70 family RNA polymerase sigma factor [Clostridia bacterium]MBQ1554527.1 sigma-70 family RNA polymerase sigma factor [Clostridia bacterium]